MSGLEKFQMNEAWRANIKKFLFMERKPETFQYNKTVTESQRYSLDIDEDLKNIIEEKKKNKKKDIANKNQLPTMAAEPEIKCKINHIEINNENTGENFEMEQKTTCESFEASENMCENTPSDPNSTFYNYLNREEQKTNASSWQQSSDESFEALEKMCEKTASDPNSTLFQYLYSDHKEQVLSDVKKRSTDSNTGFIREEEDNLLTKFNNCTLLDEIEAPSRIWENTICEATTIQTSPIKIVGLLRPSTIIEEAPDETCNSDVSSQLSFKTATKTTPSDVSSSTYDTAHNTTSASSHINISTQGRKPELEIIDVDDILLSAIEKSRKQSVNNENITNPNNCIKDVEIVKTLSSKSDDKNSITNITDNSFNLIDLEKTFEYFPNPPHSSIDGDEAIKQNTYVENKTEENGNTSDNLFDDSVIEILSDCDDDIEEEKIEDKTISFANRIPCIKSEISSNSSLSLNQETFSLNGSDNTKNDSALPESSEKSMQFNDTMEEVEYMLKKGMEYMAAAEAASKQQFEALNVPMLSLTENTAKTQHNAHVAHKKTLNNVSTSAFKAKSSTYDTPTKKTTPAKSQSTSSNRFDIDIRPFPKLDVFSKPLSNTRHKELTRKQQKFSHIVSPIGTYMKKTAKTPLMSSINSKSTNYFNSTTIQELENESHLYQPLSSTNSGKLTGLKGLSEMKRPLPKKAYISSDLKHIVDERTPVTIPGGKKIQKYLENAIMPAVLRHDGKLKMPGTGSSNKQNISASTPTATSTKQPLKASDTNSIVATNSSHVPRRNNASLADLSLMSGDVSMYTIMDAQKL